MNNERKHTLLYIKVRLNPSTLLIELDKMISEIIEEKESNKESMSLSKSFTGSHVVW